MRRSRLAVAATSILTGLTVLPAVAAATEVQIGQTTTAVAAPVCPPGTNADSCRILLTQMTGLPTLSDGQANPTLVKSDGVLSSVTVGISSAAKSYVSGLNKSWGGPPEIELTVLRRIGPAKQNRWEIAAQSSPQNLTAYQGSVQQFPLSQAIPVVPGEELALSSPTWAPVLSIDLNTSDFAYRQATVPSAATTGAAPTCTQTALGANPLSIGDVDTYGCVYTGTRVEYTAEEITTPSPTASIRLARRIDKEVRRPRRISSTR